MPSSIKKDNDSFADAQDVVVALDPKTAREVQEEQDAHVGVKTVEAAEKVYGKYSKWFLFIGYASLVHPDLGDQHAKFVDLQARTGVVYLFIGWLHNIYLSRICNFSILRA